MTTTSLLIDGFIILFYFFSIVAIGIWVGRKETSLKGFTLGGRNMPWWAVMASIIAAETSAATFLGMPSEGYAKLSLAYVQLVFGLILGRVLVAYVFLKPYYRFRVYTVYDYLDIRFGEKSKNFVSFLFLVMRTLASGTRLFVPAIVIVLAWNLFVRGQQGVEFASLNITSVWPYFWAILGLTFITFVYTAIGGIKAVIWTDVIQATLMFGSAIVALITLLYHIGGHSWNLMNGFRALGEAVPQMKTISGYFITGFEAERVAEWQETQNVDRMTIWEYVKLILWSEYTIFSALIGTTAGNMAAFGTDQDMVQRLLTAETYQKSRRSLITAAIMDLPIWAIFTFIGILLYVFYQQDPTFKPQANADVFGAYILNVMPTGVRGLVLAGVFATAMGSLSAALNSLATSATNDWYIPYISKKKTDAHHVAAARFFTGLFAVLMILIATAFAYAKVVNPDVRIIPVVLGIASFILGPMLGVFLLGMLTKRRGSDGGNIFAVAVGLFTTIFLGGIHVIALELVAPNAAFTEAVAAWQAENVLRVSWTWFALVGAVVVFIVGLLFRTPQHALDRAVRQLEIADAGTDLPVHLRK